MKFNKEKAMELAEKLGEKASDKDTKKIEKKLQFMNRGALAKIWPKVMELWNAFKSPETPAVTKAMIIGGLLYVILPFDILPDVTPVVGLLDDVFVIMEISAAVVAVLNKTLEKVKDNALEFAAVEIEKKLNESFVRSAVNLIVSFVFLISGLSLVIFQPVSKEMAFYSAWGLFFVMLLWAFLRMIKNVILIWPFLVSILKEKGIRKGIARKICDDYKVAEIYEKVLEHGNKILPALKEYPDLEGIINYYLQYFWKKLIIFGVLLGMYTILIIFTLKPYLITQFGGLKTWELYFYPIIHLFNVRSF